MTVIYPPGRSPPSRPPNDGRALQDLVVSLRGLQPDDPCRRDRPTSTESHSR